MSTPPVQCRDCHRVKRIYVRGLCHACWRHHQHRGTLDKFPPSAPKRQSGHPGKKVLLEEFTHMRSLLGHDGAVERLCDAYGLDDRTVLDSLHRYERQAA